MKVYATVYTGKKEVWEIDGDLLKFYPHLSKLAAYYKKGVGFYGNIYTVDQLFTSEKAAWNEWNRIPVDFSEHFNPETGRAFESLTEYWDKV